MIRALLIKKSKEVQSLDRDAALAWQPGQGLLWLHFDINKDETKTWLRTDEQLPHVVTAALLASEPRRLPKRDQALPLQAAQLSNNRRKARELRQTYE